MCTLIRCFGLGAISFFNFLLLLFVNCLVGCFSMIAWTPAVLKVLYACVLYFCILHLFSATEHVSHGKAL